MIFILKIRKKAAGNLLILNRSFISRLNGRVRRTDIATVLQFPFILFCHFTKLCLTIACHLKDMFLPCALSTASSMPAIVEPQATQYPHPDPVSLQRSPAEGCLTTEAIICVVLAYSTASDDNLENSNP